MRNFIRVLLVLILIGFSGYIITNLQKKPEVTTKLSVVASVYPLSYLASELGGDRVEVTTITPAGAEPHDYEPTAQDMAVIEQSKLLIMNGSGLEPWGDKVNELFRGSKITIINASGKSTGDPHLWLSPQLAKTEAAAIALGLIKIDPTNKAYYQQREVRLDQALDELDAMYKNGLVNCRQKDFVTSHAAFGYLATEFGLNQIPISGLSPDEEPSAQKLAEIANFVRNHQITYIFFERLVSPKLADTIAKETGAQTMVLDPLEGVTENDLRNGKTYITIMQENLAHLRTALECQ